MDSQVEDIKKKLDIVEVIGKFLPLKKRGRHFLTNCPFHGEKTPSFTVSQELQIYKCFGCGKAGDIFNFVQEYEHVEFKDALEDLAKMAGIVLKKNPKISQIETLQKRLVDLNHELAKFYNYILTTHPLGKSAREYVLGRGISPAMVKLFKIGFSPQNSMLAVNYLIKKGFTPKELVASGTFGVSRYRQGDFYDRFQDRLVFPLCDFRDRVLGFSGRVLPSTKNQNTAKYINSPETDIYHKSQMLFGLNLARESIKAQNSVVVVEGEFDMISPYQAGYKNFVAIKGTAFTEDQLKLLHRYTNKLIVGLDADFAGSDAAKKSIILAESIGFEIDVLDLGSQYKDPDEAVTNNPDFFKSQLENTIPVWNFIINSAVKKFDTTTVGGKREAKNMVLPFLVKISDAITRSDTIHNFANIIGSDINAVLEEAAKLSAPSSQSTNQPSTGSTKEDAKPDQKTKTEGLEEQLMALIFSARDPVALSHKIDEKIIFTTPRINKVFAALLNFNSEFAPGSFSATLPPEILPAFQDLYLESTRLNLESKQRLTEINKKINLILDIQIRKELSDLSTRIARAESEGKEDIVKTLEADYNTLLTRLSKIHSVKPHTFDS